MIEVDEMREITKRYRDPVGAVLGSHSALDAMAGLRDFGMKGVIYTTPARAPIYIREQRVGKPGERITDLPKTVARDMIVTDDISDILRKKKQDWVEAVLLLEKYEDILKEENLEALIELEALQIPNRAFSTYVGGHACERIENQFYVPIVGSRSLLKIENREEVERNYYWYLEKAGIPHPREFEYTVGSDGIRFKQKIAQPVVLKMPHIGRRLERGFIFAANGEELEAKVKEELMAERTTREDLQTGRAEEYIPGVTANFNFFYSAINAEEEWGNVEDHIDRRRLANELLSIDERRETTHDGILRMRASDQLKVDWSETPYPVAFEVTAHSMISLRESLLRKIYPIADSFVETTQEVDPPGMLGAYCVQTLITFEEQPYVEVVSQGVYDASGGSLFDFIPKTQDMAVRHGGGTNVHMGLGSQYANAKYCMPVSMGDRIALEIRHGSEKGKLDRIVT